MRGSLGVLLGLFSLGSFAQTSPDVLELREAQMEWVRSERPPLNRGTMKHSIQGEQATGVETSDDGSSPSIWIISLQDKTLYRTMRRWAAQAKYQLVWQIDRDFPIESEVSLQGTFRTAVGEVMSGVALTDFPLQAVFNSTTRVLRVVRYLEERNPVSR